MTNLKYILAVSILLIIIIITAISAAYGIVAIENYLHAHFTNQQIDGMTPNFTPFIRD